MSGAITLLPLYGFMAWTGTTLSLHLLNKEILDSQIMNKKCLLEHCGRLKYGALKQILGNVITCEVTQND